MKQVTPIDSKRGDDLMARVKATMEREGLSNAQAAREIGVSAPVLSGVMRGNYAANPANVEALIGRWLAVRDEKMRRGTPMARFSKLSVTDEISVLLGHAQATADVVLVYGAAGSGKSYAAARYAAEHSQVSLAVMSPAVSTALAALSRVAISRGLSTANVRSAAALEDLLVERLADTNALLIVDEAHHLSQALLDELRCVYDRAGCGLALLGNEPLYGRLTGGDRAAQLLSRIGQVKRLGAPVTADVELLVHDMLGRAPAAAEKKALRQVSRRYGGLRSITKLIHTAHAFALGDERERIGADDLALAAAEGL